MLLGAVYKSDAIRNPVRKLLLGSCNVPVPPKPEETTASSTQAGRLGGCLAEAVGSLSVLPKCPVLQDGIPDSQTIAWGMRSPGKIKSCS